MIWERIPKVTYVALDLFKFGVYDAVSHFNIDQKATFLMFEKLGVAPGNFCVRGFGTLNKKRLYNSAMKNRERTKKRRKILRAQSKHKSDKTQKKEGVLYEPGAF